ncbi:MAG TPA: hypothetical protein PLL22_09180, partial [Microbacteriaceae bacterium]|nr:hypothetical protein [Microbacteriaceae bacterium]
MSSVIEATEPAQGSEALIPVQTRSERPRSFDPADFGSPTGREVNWKHTPIARVAPLFVDEAPQSGAEPGVLYELDVPEAMRVVSSGHEAPVRGEFFVPEDVVSAVAWKRSTGACALHPDAHRLGYGLA